MRQKFKPTVGNIYAHMGCLVQFETPTKFVGRYNKYRHGEHMIAVRPYMIDISSDWNKRNSGGTAFLEFYLADTHKAWCLRHGPVEPDKDEIESAKARESIRLWLAETYPEGYPVWSNTELDIIVRLIKELSNGTNS